MTQLEKMYLKLECLKIVMDKGQTTGKLTIENAIVIAEKIYEYAIKI